MKKHKPVETIINLYTTKPVIFKIRLIPEVQGKKTANHSTIYNKDQSSYIDCYVGGNFARSKNTDISRLTSKSHNVSFESNFQPKLITCDKYWLPKKQVELENTKQKTALGKSFGNTLLTSKFADQTIFNWETNE